MLKKITNPEQVKAIAKIIGEDIAEGSTLTITAPKNAVARKCACGCGEMTSGGVWVPGHDAKHKSRLFNLARGTQGEEQKAAAVKELTTRGWGLPSGKKAQAVEPLPLTK
jgi:hypothetical protein